MRKIDQINSRRRAAWRRRPRHEHNKRAALMNSAAYTRAANKLAEAAPHAVRVAGRAKFIKVAKRYLFDTYGDRRMPYAFDESHATNAAMRAFAE